MTKIHLYVAVITALAVMAGIAVPWEDLLYMSQENWLTFVVLMLLGLLAEKLTVSMSVGKSGGTHSVVLIPLLASGLMFGGAAPAAFMLVTGTAGDFLFRKKELLRGVFNVSQCVFSAAIAGLVYVALGGKMQVGSQTGFDLQSQLLPFVGLLIVVMFTNQTLVARAISLSEGVSFTTVWQKIVGKAGSNLLYDILISPIAIVIALLGVELGSSGLIIAVLPILAIRHAYLQTFELQAANRDLLSALVKAIETRDPYTSGHSQRVESLAGSIAESLGVSAVRTQNIRNAALLHDIGKIESVYDGILKKSTKLSTEERVVIESHVTKGVELLRSLSSFPREVIEAVHTHHEREDGLGYPRGLRSEEIPLGGKIIAVCDAVDAMLSDRPYRKGLPASVVREELRRVAGRQFDPAVVACVTEGDLLERHAASIHVLQMVDPRSGSSTVNQQTAMSLERTQASAES